MIRIVKYDGVNDEAVFQRSAPLEDVSGVVSAILADVKENGDEALLKYSEKFDGGRPEHLEVTAEEWDQAWAEADQELIRVMSQAAENIRAFHSMQKREGFELRQEDGRVVGQRVMPVAKAGIYVPGGTAAYPSTVLMDCIPAKVAGVGEIVMVSPAKNGVISPDILAAARIAGVDRVFRTGGAQAIGALAFGTESVPKVDKIVGPGNAFVAEAKRQIFGAAGIDMVAGPSEILVVAQAGADPERLAADLLSQAEHDRNAAAVMVTDSMELAQAAAEAVERQLAILPRRDIAEASIENNGKIIVSDSIETAVEIANRWAPEHLELCVEKPFEWLDKVKNAGSVFLGASTPEAVGDYWAGANHTLPTGGTARFSSPLSVEDFIKRSQYIYYPADAAMTAADDIAYFARKEGLEGHARSALMRK